MPVVSTMYEFQYKSEFLQSQIDDQPMTFCNQRNNTVAGIVVEKRIDVLEQQTNKCNPYFTRKTIHERTTIKDQTYKVRFNYTRLEDMRRIEM